jgi:hypothetical protein
LLGSLGQQKGFNPGYASKIQNQVQNISLDSSNIRLYLNLLDRAKYKIEKGAVKRHTLLDYDGNLPAYVNIIEASIFAMFIITCLNYFLLPLLLFS